MWKGVTDNKKAKRLLKDEIKKKLLYLMTIGETVEFDNLNKEAEEVQGPQKVTIIIERYENIIKTNRRGIINVAYSQILLKINLWRKSLLQTYKQKYEILYMHSFSFEHAFILSCVSVIKYIKN